MATQLSKPSDDDARRQPRTSLLVMAALYCGSGSSPVRVRDLTSSGALVEGSVIPPAGTEVSLCRGSLNVAGEVVWRHAGRAGLRFESRITIAEWLPKGGSIAPQQRVDEGIQQINASGTAPPLSPRYAASLHPARVDAVELTKLRVAIESLAEDLAGDALVVQRHMAKLQTLDLATQVLRKLALER